MLCLQKKTSIVEDLNKNGWMMDQTTRRGKEEGVS